MSALGNAVLRVLFRGSQCHVIDIAAGRVVTQVENNERVAGFLINRDWAMNSFPSDPVGKFPRSVVLDLAVTATIKFRPLEYLAGALQAVGRWGFFQFALQSVED